MTFKATRSTTRVRKQTQEIVTMYTYKIHPTTRYTKVSNGTYVAGSIG